MAKKKDKNCLDCENAQYIGEGDVWCDYTMEIVLEDFSTPTNAYLGCLGERKGKR